MGLSEQSTEGMGIMERVIEQTLEKIKEFDISCYCQTCGEIFLTMNYYEFLRKHSFIPEMPDRWFVKAAIHWINHKDHLIIANVPYAPTNMNAFFKKMLDEKIHEFGSEEKIKLEMERYLNECKLPI